MTGLSSELEDKILASKIQGINMAIQRLDKEREPLLRSLLAGKSITDKDTGYLDGISTSIAVLEKLKACLQ